MPLFDLKYVAFMVHRFDDKNCKEHNLYMRLSFLYVWYWKSRFIMVSSLMVPEFTASDDDVGIMSPADVQLFVLRLQIYEIAQVFLFDYRQCSWTLGIEVITWGPPFTLIKVCKTTAI